MNTASRTGIFRRTVFPAVIAAAMGTVALLPLPAAEPRNMPVKEQNFIDTKPLFPAASDRTAWNAVRNNPRNRKHADELIRLAHDIAKKPVPALPATLFMEYIRSGSRAKYQVPYFQRRTNLATLVLAETFEYQGKLLDPIINYLWDITSEHTWCVPAHFNLQKDPLPEPPAEMVDLFAAETGMLLSLTMNLLENELKAVSPNLVRTVRANLERRVVNPILRKPFPFWWISGVNNWTPWCCSNCLGTALYVLKDRPERLREAVAALQKGIDTYLAKYPEDGCCTEGPAYWIKSPGMLLNYMEQLRRPINDPKVKRMAEYILHASLTPTFLASFGDCSPRVSLPGQAVIGEKRRYRMYPTAPWTCCRFGLRTGNENLMRMGLLAAEHYPTASLPRDLFTGLAYFFWVPPEKAGPIKKQTLVFYPVSQMVFLNDAGVTFAAKRGGKGSHQHSDIGQVILLFRGRPLLIDLGSTEYRRETFSSRRFENWIINAEGHNVPQFNGIRQLDAAPVVPNAMTVAETPGKIVCRIDLTKAYPEQAGVKSCIRELIWNGEEQTLEIRDSWKLGKSANTVRIPFYTIGKAEGKDGKWQIDGVEVRLKNCSASVADVPLQDRSQRSFWGKSVKRIDVTAKSAAEGNCSLIFNFKK